MSAFAVSRGSFTPINAPGQSTIGGGGEDPKKPHDHPMPRHRTAGRPGDSESLLQMQRLFPDIVPRREPIGPPTLPVLPAYDHFDPENNKNDDDTANLGFEVMRDRVPLREETRSYQPMPRSPPFHEMSEGGFRNAINSTKFYPKLHYTEAMENTLSKRQRKFLDEYRQEAQRRADEVAANLAASQHVEKYRQYHEALADAGILASADVLDEDEEAFSTTLIEDPQNLAEEAGMDADVKDEEDVGNRGNVVLCVGVRRISHELVSVCVEVLKKEKIFEEESGLLCYEDTSLLREHYEFDDEVTTRLMPSL